jgi:hypothetical protein
MIFSIEAGPKEAQQTLQTLRYVTLSKCYGTIAHIEFGVDPNGYWARLTKIADFWSSLLPQADLSGLSLLRRSKVAILLGHCGAGIERCEEIIDYVHHTQSCQETSESHPDQPENEYTSIHRTPVISPLPDLDQPIAHSKPFCLWSRRHALLLPRPR